MARRKRRRSKTSRSAPPGRAAARPGGDVPGNSAAAVETGGEDGATDPASVPGPGWRALAAMALAACAVLLFEIAATRILSVVLWYHWAFLSVSVAMAGLGAPGVWFALRPPGPRAARRLLLLAAPLFPFAAAVLAASGRLGQPLSVIACLAVMLLPALALGAAICVFLVEARGRAVATMYGADLVGACVGALAVIPLMSIVDTPRLAASIGLLAVLAALILEPRAWRAPSAVGLAIALVAAWGAPFAIEVTKEKDERETPPVVEAWTPTVRLTVFDTLPAMFADGFFWGEGSSPREPRGDVEQLWLDQDGSAGTPITRFDGDVATVRYLLDDVTSLPFQLARPAGRVAIIGSGGGRDILAAKAAGAAEIDAVELHGALVELVSGRFGEFSGDVYGLDGVRAVVSEGRAFLARTDARYDVVQISMIDSWAATAAGAYALSENYLYTLEAFRLYWSRLADEGLLSATRWARGPRGMELPRLVLLASAALEAEGVARPAEHLAVAESGAVATLIVSKSPIDGARRARLEEICRRRGFALRHPGEPDGAIGRLLTDGAATLEAGVLDLSPPTDDRPFFFQVVHPLAFGSRELVARLGSNQQAVVTLQSLFVALAAATAVLFFGPFLLGAPLAHREGFLSGSAFFAAIGLAFMLVEIPWLHRFVLLLGYPSVAATVVLGALLLGAGLGSLAAGRLPPRGRALAWIAAPLLVAALQLALDPLFRGALGASVATRVALTAAVLVPVGLSLGVFFPSGMIAFGERNRAWFWAVNGATSVLGSVSALVLAMALGLAAVTWIGAALYVVAGLLLFARSRVPA